MSEHEDVPPSVDAAGRLSAQERRRVAGVALAPVGVAVLILAPVGVVTGAGVDEVLGAALVYGGLLGLVAAFVAVDRIRARQCPVCGRRPARGTPRCRCGYDLARRPRYACEQRHAIYLDDGVCGCGETLQEVPTATGVVSQAVVSLRTGGWLALFLVLVGGVVYVLEGRL